MTEVTHVVEKRRVKLTSWLGTIAVTVGVLTTAWNLGSGWLEKQRAHAVEDRAREDERVSLRKQLSEVVNRIGALEYIDYRVHPEYTLDIVYANGERKGR